MIGMLYGTPWVSFMLGMLVVAAAAGACIGEAARRPRRGRHRVRTSRGDGHA